MGEPIDAVAARRLHRLTGLPAVIEARHGNPHAWAGPGRPDPYPKPPPRQRQEFLRQLTRRGSVMRVKDRLVTLARTRNDAMLGVLALVDAGGTGGPHEVLALEHGVPWCSPASSRASTTLPNWSGGCAAIWCGPLVIGRS